MHTEYIVSSRNLDKKSPVPFCTEGPPLKVIYMMCSFISFCALFFTCGPCGQKTIWCFLNISFIFEISVHISVRKRSNMKRNKKIILTNKNTPFVKKRYKKNQTSTYSVYQLEKRCLLVKGCVAFMWNIHISSQKVK